MKKLAALILCTITAVITGGGAASAYAEANTFAENSSAEQTVYPQFVSDLDVSADCYAATEGQFAFAQSGYLYIYSYTSDPADGCTYTGGSIERASSDVSYAYRHSTDITAIAYANGELIFADADGGVYAYSDGKAETSAQEIPSSPNVVTDDSAVIAYTIEDGALVISDFINSPQQLTDGVYSALSGTESGAIYVLKDGALCRVSGSTVSEVSFEYADVSHGERIAVGDDARAALGTAPGTDGVQVQFATVPAGQYVTNIDLSDISGQYFATGGDGTGPLAGDVYALVLCNLDSAAIISVGGKAYITSPLSARVYATAAEAPFAGAQLNYPAGLYSSPYMCEATRLLSLDAGATVTVNYEIKADDQLEANAMTADFCFVTYTDGNGASTSGYIATSFLTEYTFAADDGGFELTDPDNYSEENVVLTVVLIIVIVVLVIAGVAYLAYFSGSNRRKKRGQTDEGGDKDKNE